MMANAELIHPTAIIHASAKLADDVKVGAYSIIQPMSVLTAALKFLPMS